MVVGRGEVLKPTTVIRPKLYSQVFRESGCSAKTVTLQSPTRVVTDGKHHTPYSKCIRPYCVHLFDRFVEPLKFYVPIYGVYMEWVSEGKGLKQDLASELRKRETEREIRIQPRTPAIVS